MQRSSSVNCIAFIALIGMRQHFIIPSIDAIMRSIRLISVAFP